MSKEDWARLNTNLAHLLLIIFTVTFTILNKPADVYVVGMLLAVIIRSRP